MLTALIPLTVLLSEKISHAVALVNPTRTLTEAAFLVIGVARASAMRTRLPIRPVHGCRIRAFAASASAALTDKFSSAAYRDESPALGADGYRMFLGHIPFAQIATGLLPNRSISARLGRYQTACELREISTKLPKTRRKDIGRYARINTHGT